MALVASDIVQDKRWLCHKWGVISLLDVLDLSLLPRLHLASVTEKGGMKSSVFWAGYSSLSSTGLVFFFFWIYVSMVTSCFISCWLQIFIPIASSILEQIVCYVNYLCKCFHLSSSQKMSYGCLFSAGTRYLPQFISSETFCFTIGSFTTCS